MNKPLFYDTDCLSSFLGVNRADLLQRLFSKIIISQQVKDEFDNEETPSKIKERLKLLIDDKFVEIKEIYLSSKEGNTYFELKSEYEDIGKGELSVLALAITYNGVIASNNLKDICKLIRKYELEHITSAVILFKCFENDFISMEETEQIWQEMLNNTIKLPKSSFKEYYSYEDKLCYN